MIFQKILNESLIKNASSIAITDATTSYTYEEVLEKANLITQELLSTNIESGTHVGIVVEDRAHFIISMIGILNAACVFVPIDGTLPMSRLKEMSQQLDLNYLITSNANLVAPFSISNVYELDAVFGKTLEDLSLPSFHEEDSLYVYFTSGSTGVPKGVVGKNKSLTQFVQWEIEEFAIDESAKFSQFISPYFDAFLRDVFVPLVAGATVAIPPTEEDFFTAEKMIPWIHQNEISVIHCVPSLFRVFSDKNRIQSTEYTALKYVLMSGEKIIPKELSSWYNTFQDRIGLVNLYGTTETTMIRSFYRIQPSDIKKSRMPIGQPIHDTQLRILNKNGKENGPLIPGELYIVSDFMTKGYLKRPELNAEKFVTLEDGKSAFKTGDKARLLADGNIELLGREDRQVKIRGIRVELDEIENLLRASSLVGQVVVINHQTKNSNAEMTEKLVCFATKGEAAPGNQNFIHALESYAQEHIPAYMQPSIFMEVETFPLLTSGKIDFKALTTLLEENNKQIIAPTNDTEVQLLTIWKAILKQEEISTDDSFLKIGGNSLSLMQLIAKIYAHFGVRIPLGEIFKSLTITQQANFILNTQQQDNSFEIKKVEEKPLYVLSTGQQRMYINYDVNRDNLSYNMPAVAEITGEVNVPKIEEVLNKLIQRDEALRTIFEVNEQGVFQKIVENPTFQVEEKNVATIDQGINNFVKPFNLNTEIPIRAAVMHTVEGNKFLIIDVHHIVCDGISQRNLFRDFLMLYNGQSLQPLKFQFKDYAEWEASFMETSAYVKQKEFWIKSFEKPVNKLELPQVNDVDLATPNQGSNIVFQIDPSGVAPVLTALEKENVTPFAVFYTYLSLALLQLTGQEDFVIGLGTSGRIQEEIQPNIGMFVKSLPIRYEFELQKSFRTVAKEVNEHLMNAINNELYDLGDIIREVRKKGNQDDELFNVMFTYLNYDFDEMSPVGQDFQPYNFDKSEVKFPMNFVISEPVNFNSNYEVAFEYNHQYFNEESAHEFVAAFKELIERVPEKFDEKIYDLVVADQEVDYDLEDDITFNF